MVSFVLKQYIILLRPHQYVKNLFIFMPMFFGLKLADPSLVVNTFLVFCSFCMIASAVYIFNDYHDIELDRKHPQKRFRPLALGRIKEKTALILMLALVLLGFMIPIYLDIRLAGFFLLYLVINVLYSLKIKHIAILDVFTIAIGFVVRLFIGSTVSQVNLSMWILTMTFLLALFLAFAKRRDDILVYFDGGEKTRRVIDGYNLEFLNAAMMIVSSVTIVAYIMYTMSQEVIAKVGSHNLFLTTIFVVLGILRYLQITLVQLQSGSPTRILLKDRFLQSVLAAWLISFSWILYWR